MRRVIERSKPKEMIFKTLVQDYFLTNPKVDKATIEIKEDKLTRSGAQNKLYWMWLNLIEKETGQPVKDCVEGGVLVKGLHTNFKRNILGMIEYSDGDMKERSTKDLKVKAFTEYLERIDREMAEFGIVLPRPDDYYWLAMGVKAP